MWFGDLVTIEEWSYLWMKEGFAQFFGIYFPDKLYSDVEYTESNLNYMCADSKYLDARTNARPMTQHVYDPVSIDRMFDYISYDKGKNKSNSNM